MTSHVDDLGSAGQGSAGQGEPIRPSLRQRLRTLYLGGSPRSHRFRLGSMAFDLVTVLFIVVTSFIPPADWIEALDLVFGVVILADYIARLAISRRPVREFFNPLTLADLVSVISFLAPLTGEGFGFLRVFRTLRLLHSYQLIAKLREEWPWFQRNQDAILAATHLCVFVFIMTAIVYETQHWTNPAISNYADALYFTITALTTTGFGDITLPGTLGRMISVVIMIAGVTLFLRLAQVLFRPHKVRFDCPQCGLMRHDLDAVHCKHCGLVLNIKNEGD